MCRIGPEQVARTQRTTLQRTEITLVHRNLLRPHTTHLLQLPRGLFIQFHDAVFTPVQSYLHQLIVRDGDAHEPSDPQPHMVVQHVERLGVDHVHLVEGQIGRGILEGQAEGPFVAQEVRWRERTAVSELRLVDHTIDADLGRDVVATAPGQVTVQCIKMRRVHGDVQDTELMPADVFV